jgi:hypothetical protein
LGSAGFDIRENRLIEGVAQRRRGCVRGAERQALVYTLLGPATRYLSSAGLFIAGLFIVEVSTVGAAATAAHRRSSLIDVS